MIWDCFTFFNELELLDIRLNILDKYVDKFVLVEGTITHSCKPKPLYFDQYKSLYKKFLDKIVHVVVEDMPVNKDYWIPERFQRNAISRALVKANPSDIILISDLDEIPRPAKFREIKSTGISIFLLDYYIYYLNSRSPDEPDWNMGTRAVHLGEMVSPQETRMWGSNRNPIGDKYAIFNGGWHFSYTGGLERVQEHLANTPDQQLRTYKVSHDINVNKELIEKGKDPTGWRPHTWRAVPIDDTFPKYIIDNQDKFTKLILANEIEKPAKTKKSTTKKSSEIVVEKSVDLSKGLLYMVFGEKSTEAATRSIESLRKFNADLPIATVGLRQIPGTQFIQWKGHSPFVDNREDPTHKFFDGHVNPYIYVLTPFERTLYIDADTTFYRDPLMGFDYLDKYDFAIAEQYPLWAVGVILSHRIFPSFSRKCTRYILRDIYANHKKEPNLINSGVIFFKKTSGVELLFKEWGEEWLKFIAWDEQLPLLRVMMRHENKDVKILKLDDLWNCSKRSTPEKQKHQIIHHDFSEGAAKDDFILL